MTRSTRLVLGIACVLLCAFCCYAAWERYDYFTEQMKVVKTTAAQVMPMPRGVTGYQNSLIAQLESRGSTEMKYAIGGAIFFACMTVVIFVVPSDKQQG